MDVREELRSLTSSAPRPPSDDGLRVYRRGRQRLVRRRAGAGLTGLALVVLLVAVAWPGTVPGGLVIEDEIADQPDAETPVLDLPEGWQQVEVGDAVLGIPADRHVVDLAPEVGPPCGNDADDRYAYVLRGGFPADPDAGCRDIGASFTSLYAAPLSLVPAETLVGEDLAAGLAWEATTVDGTEAEEIVLGEDDASETMRYLRYPTEIGGGAGEVVELRIGEQVLEATYTSTSLDLWLRFEDLDLEPDLADDVVSTVVPAAEASAGAPDDGDPAPDSGAEADQGATGDAVTEVEVGGATITVPAAFAVERVPPDATTPCLLDTTAPTAYVAADGAPFEGVACDADEPSTTSVMATRLSTVPPAWLPGHADVEGPAPRWEPLPLGGAEAERVDDAPNGVLVVRSEELDLYLEVSGAELGPALVDELLTGIRPTDANGA